VGTFALALPVSSGGYMKRWCPELTRREYGIWTVAEAPVILLSLFGGLALAWQAFFWLGAICLVYSLYTVFREQSYPPGSLRRKRLQKERLVAGAAAIDGVGRKLAQKSPQQRRLGTPRSAPVADGHRLVCHLHPWGGRSCEQGNATQSMPAGPIEHCRVPAPDE
jgi:hypothetical protein